MPTRGTRASSARSGTKRVLKEAIRPTRIPPATSKARKRTPADVFAAGSISLDRAGASAHMLAAAPGWYEGAFGGRMSDEYKAYMRDEWGREKRGDQPLFEKLCLEGAQAGLSWATILAKREAYRRAFYNFDIAACAAMTDADIERLLQPVADALKEDTIVRHRGKITSVQHNARCVLALIKEREEAGVPRPQHGHFDEYLWSYVGGSPKLNRWASFSQMPSEDAASIEMAKALKKRGFKFVGAKICYSLMQSCGLVIDHPIGTPEWNAAALRLGK